MSGEKVPYHLRQNKFIERELFIDLLGQVDRRNPISEYLYVGFGGAYLEDFKILHSAFGNKSMLSLEQLPWIHERQQFNLPYGCVTCTNKTSGDFIDEFADILNEFKTPPLLVWLDYADTDWRSQLNEYVALSSKLRKGDILKITLNVNPATLGGRDLAENDDEDALAENLRQKRLETVTEKLGEFLPNEATQSDLQTKRFPALMLKALRAAAFRGLSGSIGMDLHPISAVTYSDTHKMLTVTAIMLEKNEVQEFLITTGLKTHDFTTNNWNDIIEIDVPYLSVREKMYLDTVLFKRTKKKIVSKLKNSTRLKIRLAPSVEGTRKKAEEYMKFYRYYPHYHRIHY